MVSCRPARGSQPRSTAALRSGGLYRKPAHSRAFRTRDAASPTAPGTTRGCGPRRGPCPDPRSGARPATASASTPPSDLSDAPSLTGGPALRTVLDRLAAAYGPQEWWPARSRFEMMAGALLTQRTTWRNAARALAALQRAGALSPAALARFPIAEIEALVRPAGTFRVKAARLQAMARWYIDSGGWEDLAVYSTPELRTQLLELSGIGAETADDILLYAFERPSSSLTPTRGASCRAMAGPTAMNPTSDSPRRSRARLAGMRRCWASFTRCSSSTGKRHCRAAPRCKGCPLATQCRTGICAAGDAEP